MSTVTEPNKFEMPQSASKKVSSWEIDELPQAPVVDWRHLVRLVGPGVMLAGASVGAGEWLFGPAVSAQYGGTLLWLGAISVILQAFYNLEVMRYTLYCGEPIHVGFCRTWPGPTVWVAFYVMLEFTNIWPFMAANAAVPLTAAVLGHLPGDAAISLLGFSLSETGLVKLLGYVIFLAAIVPLIFGGTVYRILESVFTAKLFIVLGFLIFVTLFMVSGGNAWEVVTGFFRFGAVPLRADTVIDDRHFTFSERVGPTLYTVKGTLEDGRTLVTAFVVNRGEEVQTFGMGALVPAELQNRQRRLVARAEALIGKGRFFVQDTEGGITLTVEGPIGSDRSWQPGRFSVREAGVVRNYVRLEEVPKPHASRFRALVTNRGAERASLIGYTRKHGRLPDLDWALLAGLVAIAGAGGLTNSLFSNYTRDKGWGMGARVGAIPSAVGGRTITLSHVGRVFQVTGETLNRWRGWIRHILRDQGIWVVCSLVGMALPCMMSLEFIRNAPLAGDRVAAMSAQGMAARYPDYAYILWPVTLMISFIVLAPNQIQSGDTLPRRWSDVLWTVSGRTQRLKGSEVKYLYYGILTMYGVWGLFALAFFDPLQIAKIGTVLANLALGTSGLHLLYVNRTLLPPELRPNWFMQAGVLCSGLFFVGITVLVISTL